jgi:hypothetical protein
MGQPELANVRTFVERDEDGGDSLMHAEDWWYEAEEAFLAEVREAVPPRLLVDLARAPLVSEKHIRAFKRLNLTRAR